VKVNTLGVKKHALCNDFLLQENYIIIEILVVVFAIKKFLVMKVDGITILMTTNYVSIVVKNSLKVEYIFR